MSSIKQAVLKVAQANPEFRKALVAELKAARTTTPLLEMKYQNLGDFGGTNRVLESWVLEVGGPTERIMSELRRLKFYWNRATRTWRIDATSYAAGQYGRPAKLFALNRKKQEVAYKILKPLIAQENELIKEENRGIVGDKPKLDTKELVTMIRRNERIRNSLESLGVKMDYSYPGRYGAAGDEPLLLLGGDTYDIKELLKRYGFRWEGSRKMWKLPLMEYEAVKQKFIPALVQALKA